MTILMVNHDNVYQSSSPLVNISASVGHGAYALGYQTAFDAGMATCFFFAKFKPFALTHKYYFFRQVRPHEAQLGGGIQRWGHDHPRHCQ